MITASAKERGLTVVLSLSVHRPYGTPTKVLLI